METGESQLSGKRAGLTSELRRAATIARNSSASRKADPSQNRLRDDNVVGVFAQELRHCSETKRRGALRRQI